MRFLALIALTVLALVVAFGGAAATMVSQYACAMGAAYTPGVQSLIEGCDPLNAVLLLGGGFVAVLSILGVILSWIIVFSRRDWRFAIYAASPGYALAILVLAILIAIPFQVAHEAQNLIP